MRGLADNRGPAGMILMRAVRHWRWGMASLALYAAVALGADTQDGYRLAGIIAAGNDWLGFLEVPQGGQVVIRKGAHVNGGEVTAISAQLVRIRFFDRELELRLSGAPGGDAPPASARAAPAVAAADRPSSPSKTDLMAPPIVRTVPRPMTLLFQTNGIARPTSRVDAGQYVAQQIAPVFDIPDNTRVVAINDARVSSAAQASDVLSAALSNGIAVLDLETPNGPQRAYLMAPHH
jgi:hypothetical protein